MIDDVKSAKFFLDNVYFWKLGIVDDNGVDDDDDDDDSNSYLDPGLQKETCRLLCHGERSLNATTASSSSSSLHSPYLFVIDIITIAIVIITITMTKLQCNRLPDHSVLKNNRRLNSRELPFLTCTPAHPGALYICW